MWQRRDSGEETEEGQKREREKIEEGQQRMTLPTHTCAIHLVSMATWPACVVRSSGLPSL